MSLPRPATGATGVRVSGVGGDEPVWLRDGRATAVWDAAAETKMVVVVNLRPEYLVSLAELSAAEPAAVVALDHCGFVRYGARVGDDQGLLRLAELPGIHLKVSSLNLGGNDAPDWLGRLVASFGAGRLCWGSDHPQMQELTYAQMRHLSEERRCRAVRLRRATPSLLRQASGCGGGEPAARRLDSAGLAKLSPYTSCAGGLRRTRPRWPAGFPG